MEHIVVKALLITIAVLCLIGGLIWYFIAKNKDAPIEDSKFIYREEYSFETKKGLYQCADSGK